MGGFSHSIQSRYQRVPVSNLSKAQLSWNRMLEMEKRRKAIREAEEKRQNDRMNRNYSAFKSEHDDQ